MSLLDRHLAFVAALRRAGMPVSLAEGLDAVEAIGRLGIGDRAMVKEAYAATLVKRYSHRAGFEEIFDLYFPVRVGNGWDGAELTTEEGQTPDSTGTNPRLNEGEGGDGPRELGEFREALVATLTTALGLGRGPGGRGELGDTGELGRLAIDGVQRFGLIRGRGEGEQRWSAYNVLSRVAPDELVERVLRGLGLEPGEDPSTRRLVHAQVREFEQLVDAEVRRRAAEVRGPDHVAKHSVRPTIENLEFTAARKTDLERMRREIQPLARRLATRLSKERHAQRARGPLDFPRTIRASMGSGGIPLETRHRPRHPGRSDLVVLCDVSGSVANFASFTLMLVFALREHFTRLRAFTFVDDIHEVTDRFTAPSGASSGASGGDGDPARVMADLAASARQASLWGRTNYGRAFTRFGEEYGDALTPRTNLLVLGDARSNNSDLALPVVKQLVHDSRRSWWLNPEHARHWNTGDSAAREYAELIPMVECRNLTQLGEFVHDLA